MHISTYIFPARVVDRFASSKVFARTKINATFISVQTAFFGDVVRDDHDHHLICMSYMEVAAAPIVPDLSDDGTLVRWERFAAFRVRNDVGVE
jgi:hypothetical protein